MTRLEELTLKLADDAINDGEARELEVLLAAEPEAADAHRRLLEVEAALRSQRETLDLAGPTVATLRSELGGSVGRAVMQRLAAEPPPAWARSRTIAASGGVVPNLNFLPEVATEYRSHRGNEADFRRESEPRSASSRRRLRPLLNRPAVLAFAASVLLLLGLSVWFFGATMGQPVLAEVQGVDASIERRTEHVPAATGTVLQAADILRLGTNASATITFGAEQTRLELTAGTELKLASLARGKRFVLQEGRIEVSVARQRPFQPMIITTPQAEARVLGTKFSLLTTANATRLEVTKGKVRLTRTSDSKAVQVSAGHYAVAASNYVLAAQPLPGKVLREVWLDLPGDTLQDLRYHARFPKAPTLRDFPPSFETSTNWPIAYGTRTRAYLLPPTNGNYEFRFPDNVPNGQVSLFLSPDEEPADKQRICQTVFTRNRPEDPGIEGTRASNQSGPLRLEAGKRYYIEALHKYGTGEDRLSVLWKRPDRAAEEPVPSDCLAPFKVNTKEKKR